MQTYDEQCMQSHMDSTTRRVHAADPVRAHGLDPLAAEDAEDDHERVEEVGEVPQRHDARLREPVERVVGAEQHSTTDLEPSIRPAGSLTIEVRSHCMRYRTAPQRNAPHRSR